MKRVSVSLIGLVLLVTLPGSAAADIDLTFETVDEVRRVAWEEHSLHVRGIPQGQSEPVEVAATIARFSPENDRLAQAASCERMALLAASRPGRYLFRILTSSSDGREWLSDCRLVRR